MKSRMLVFMAILSAVALAGCALPGGEAIHVTPASGVRVVNSKFSGIVEYVGAPIIKVPLVGTSSTTSIDVGCGKVQHTCASTVDVGISYTGANWVDLHTAELVGGRELEVTPESHDVSDCQILCNYDERVSVTLPSGFLKAHERTGFQVKVGSYVFGFTPQYVHKIVAFVEGSGNVFLPATLTSAQ